ncbi:MAG TPA: iron ABC transporter permease [Anaerolineaceae bacterium]
MTRPLIISLLILVVAFVLSVAVGSVYIPPTTLLGLFASHLGLPLSKEWLQARDTAAVILFQLRLPRAILVAMVGAALSGSGAAYQGLFRNPLADPYLIGVASGAGLGAVLAMAINWPVSFLGLTAVPAAAFVFGLISVALVYFMARVGRTVPTTNLILAGVAVGSFATAVSSYLMLRSQGDLRRAIAWLLGGGTLSGWNPVLAASPYLVIGLGTLLVMGHALNVLQFGDEQAQQLGLPVETVRRIVIVAASLTTAAAVAFAGIIGFVGLVIPHVVRMAWGGDYRRLIPLSILCGASLLLLADLLARVVISPEELPVGVITALVGAPFFLWVLRRSKAQAFW